MNLAHVAKLLTTHREDARRIGLFAAAIQQKVVQLVLHSPEDVPPFFLASSVLMADWANRSVDVAKAPWRFFFKDPYFELRQRTRNFAADWDLAPEFREAIG